MGVTQHNFLKLLKQHVNRFDTESDRIKQDCLKIRKKFGRSSLLLQYHDFLLYILAHPNNSETQKLAERELKLISGLLKKGTFDVSKLENSGLPFSTITTLFSHDLLRWMMEKGYRVQGTPNDEEKLAAVLRFTLPTAEREVVTYGYSHDQLLEALKLKPNHLLPFLVEQFNGLNDQPFLKDYLFDSTETYVTVPTNQPKLSRSYNRFLKRPVFYHQDLLKRFDHVALIDSELPAPTSLTENEREDLISTIKNSMILTARETDPATYLLPETLRFYELERGIAVAIYGMYESRQLPFESYIGYTLFKNGFPTAYGGAWIFGKRSLFGMNIFEAFRGGESGYMMCQLLRVYRQVFQVGSIEIEPYQFGKDNPDGIRSGAFWFYYRYGFRPMDRHLRQLAKKESEKITATKGYQSSYKTLERFTDSFISLDIEPVKQTKVTELCAKITAHIAKTYKGQRQRAERESLAKLGMGGDAGKTTKEYALLADAMHLKAENKIQLIKELIAAKPKDPYAYQQLLLRFFSEE